MRSTEDRRQRCIDQEGAYHAEGRSRYHTRACCPRGSRISEDNLKSGRPLGEAEECFNCSYDPLALRRRTGDP